MRRKTCLLLSIALIAALVAVAHAAVPQDVWKTVKTEEIMETVRSIGIERTVGTSGHQAVQTYIETYLRQHAPAWKVEKDAFSDNTPVGLMNFANYIATLDAVPGQVSDKYLVLAAHYESKILRGQRFEAAIDSAVPCAILLQFARHFDSIAKANLLAGTQGHNWGIKLIFFDGEEAFHEWTATDSIYGSRHLAQEWSAESDGLLSKIKLFVLLDLLGAPNMVPIPSRYPSTAQQFNYFVEAQSAAQAAGKLNQRTQYFNPSPSTISIEDDHIPWLRRGVPIVHLIPAPFPSVWHTSRDTVANLDRSAVTHLTGLIHLAVLNYLENN